VLDEGVETPGEIQFLREQDCEEIQGYLIGRPAAIEKFRDLTHDGDWSALEVDDAVIEMKIA
jgi:EAL domain-containing protein (putative c-di-GMP-specific phosphodiesterase class I)